MAIITGVYLDIIPLSLLAVHASTQIPIPVHIVYVTEVVFGIYSHMILCVLGWMQRLWDDDSCVFVLCNQ